MRVRLTKVDEFQFLTCVKNSVWGSKNARFSDWRVGDFLAIIVEKQIAGLARVEGPSYHSEVRIWDNGVFPHRIPVKFDYLFNKQHRPQILGPIRDVLIKEWTPKYGWGILNQRLIDDSNAEVIVREITSRPSDADEIRANLDDHLAEAKAGRPVTKKKQQPRATLISESYVRDLSDTHAETDEAITDIAEPLTPKEESLHSKAQYLLARIGKVVGCKSFIASNDRKRTFNGTELGSLAINILPQLGLNDEAMKRISLIDVIWLKQNAPMCAFEVETSTSVYSGLLRMSDLISVVPALNIKLYIVAQSERKRKVLSELARPTFRKIGLNDYCEFISIDDLEQLLKTVESLAGHVQPSILDTITVGLPDED